MRTRPPLDTTLMNNAREWAYRSVCTRLQVGAILVRDGRPFAQGYNGPARGEPACAHTLDKPCTESIHAETNVLLNAGMDGHATRGATMFVTHSPCYQCAGNIINSKIVEVVYEHPYRLDDGLRRLKRRGITVRPFG